MILLSVCFIAKIFSRAYGPFEGKWTTGVLVCVIHNVVTNDFNITQNIKYLIVRNNIFR